MYLRLGSKAVARGVTAVLIACSLASCGREGRAVTVSWSIAPTPPMVAGETLVVFRLRDAGGKPVSRARLRFEAHMSHPGMTPVTADVIEQSAGTYEAQVRLPMAGDWRFVVAVISPTAAASPTTRPFPGSAPRQRPAAAESPYVDVLRLPVVGALLHWRHVRRAFQLSCSPSRPAWCCTGCSVHR